jgi:hypothetical protein
MVHALACQSERSSDQSGQEGAMNREAVLRTMEADRL